MVEGRTPRVLVIGVGNAFRRDDGAGCLAAQRIAQLALPGVQVMALSGEGAELLEAWRGFESVIVIDATSSGHLPGTIHQLDAGDCPIPTEFFHYSTHAFSLAEAVELARALGELPPRMVVFGIEGESFAAGEGLSAPVMRAVEEVVRRIRDEILSEQACRHAGRSADAYLERSTGPRTSRL